MTQSLLILNYHRVGRPPASSRYRGHFVTPGHLEFHVQTLRCLGYRFLTLQQAVGSPTPGKTAVLTFDDGYLDNLQLGLPVLHKHSVPATVFVITSDVGKRHHMWQESGEKLPSDLMGWDELRELKNHWGWEIGSHCREHRHLERLSAAEQENLIGESFKDLTDHLGEAPYSFAYPYGSIGASTPGLVQKAGFQCAVTTRPPVAQAPRDLYLLPRFNPKGYRFTHAVQSAWHLWQASRQ